MKTAYLELIRFSLAKGLNISVFDGEEWAVKNSTSLRTIDAAIKSVEAAELEIRDAANQYVAWALVSPYGLAPDETVMNSSCNAFFDEADAVIYA